MTQFLVVTDPAEDEQFGLLRLKNLSPGDDIQVHVAAYIEAEDASTFANTFRERTKWLEELVVPYQEQGFSITSELIMFDKLYMSILETALKVSADIIIKPTRHHSTLRQMVITSTDWNLIRFSSVPVLLVGHQADIQGKPVVCAVDVCNEDENHQALNHIVLEQGRVVAGVLGSEINIVNAWTHAVASTIGEPVPMDYSTAVRKEHVEAARELAEQYGITAVHVEEGATDHVVNDVVEATGAGIIVLGTVARKGLAGMFVGNTAERVLEKSRVDVLVVKPGDFESPLELNVS